MTERFSMPGLKPGVWTVDVAQDEDLEAALGRAGRLGANVQGIAYTTAGARALQSVSGQSLCDTGDKEVPLDTVYELRLWAVTRRDGEDDGVLARLRLFLGQIDETLLVGREVFAMDLVRSEVHRLGCVRKRPEFRQRHHFSSVVSSSLRTTRTRG